MKRISKKRNLKILGDALKKARIDAGLSQNDLSKLTDIDRAYISRTERGLHNPNIITLCVLCKYLELSLSDACEGMPV